MPSRIGGALNRRLAPFLFRQTVHMRNTRPLVSFTFDDAPRSAGTTGADILEAAGACGTYYVCGGLCDTAADGMPYLLTSDLAALNGRGHEIGCHTFSHVPVPSLTRSQIERELAQNSRFAHDAGADLMLRNFSYPFGDVSPATRGAVQSHFASCRGIHPGVNRGTIDLGLLKAVSIYDRIHDTTRIERYLDEARQNNGWLIFYTHDVQDGPSHHGTSPKLFETLVSRTRALGIDIVTVRSALGELGFRRAEG